MRAKYRSRRAPARCPLALCLLLGVLLASPSKAVEKRDAYVVDVTPASFAVVWPLSGPATPGVELYADPAGTVPLDGLRVAWTPLEGGGDPDAPWFENTLANTVLADRVRERGLVLARVFGLSAGQTVYLRLTAEDGDRT